VASLRASKSVALKVNSLPFTVNLLSSAPPTITNRDTKRISFTTTEAMEGRTYVLSVLVNGVLATTTVEVNFSRLIALGGFDINTISGITSSFKICGFES
jgi:hypothetical protein